MATELQEQAQEKLWRKMLTSRLGGSTLATTATTGYMQIATTAGVPTGVPDGGNGSMVIDTSNNRLYFYSSGAWRNAGP